ncbi:MAG: MotA/TolQ/ExbB proton channel family protein, partial [Cyanobacteria bacterium P01_H01_bin.119]
IAMWPLLFLSILTLGTVFERIWFWSKILTREREVAGRVLEAARREWSAATDLAERASPLPMGRFLYSALKLTNPDPEVFRLALETAAHEELAAMRRGDKVLEAVIALAPLLGLLGTVVGLINALGSIQLSDLGSDTTAETALGIGQALISTATGLVIAIVSVAFYRLFQGFVFGQGKVFRQSGSELELLYRQAWAAADGKPMTAGKSEPARDKRLPRGRSLNRAKADGAAEKPSKAPEKAPENSPEKS